ncbi:MAG TPA: hypothetical protein VMA35_08030 [Candidatus Sulfopaludibacter sp.]|nr:hypothetical protein [Candidatus Sulfopaludibacter sp.]
MKKLEKIFWSVVLALVVVVIIGAVVAGVFLGDIVKKGVEVVGPKITRVPVTVADVRLTLLTGSASIKGLVVGNPTGYQTPQAISAGLISIGVNPLSVLSDKIVVRSLHVESPEITFEGGLGGNNLSTILNNVNAASQNPASTSAAPTTAPAQAKPARKLEVDDLLITGAQVHVSLTDLGGKEMTLPLPPIHLTDLGKNQDGITATELTRSVLDAIVSATVKAVGKASTDIGKNGGSLLKGAGSNAGAGTSNLIKGFDKLLGK